MKLIVKQIIVMIIVFIIILWFQNNDDKKYKRSRVKLFDKYKLPLLVSTIVGLILNFPVLFKMNDISSKNSITEINILTPIREAKMTTHTNLKDIINNLQISTDMPDF
jgi:predicted permease